MLLAGMRYHACILYVTFKSTLTSGSLRSTESVAKSYEGLLPISEPRNEPTSLQDQSQKTLQERNSFIFDNISPSLDDSNIEVDFSRIQNDAIPAEEISTVATLAAGSTDEVSVGIEKSIDFSSRVKSSIVGISEEIPDGELPMNERVFETDENGKTGGSHFLLAPKVAAYINQGGLERLLRSKFGGNVEDFNVQVCRSNRCCQPILAVFDIL
jgi:hypothetical protein